MKKIQKAVCFSWADTGKSLLIFVCAVALCAVLKCLGESDSYSLIIFELAVFLTARYTQGYFYGMAMAIGLSLIHI